MADDHILFNFHAVPEDIYNRAVVEVFDERILRETMANYPRFEECLEAGITYDDVSTPISKSLPKKMANWCRLTNSFPLPKRVA